MCSVNSQTQEGVPSPPSTKCCALSMRYRVAWMASTGFFIASGIRCNLDFLLETIREDDSGEQGGVIADFNAMKVGMLIFSFLFGYSEGMIIAGVVAAKYRAHLLFVSSIGLLSVLNLLMPLAAKIGPSLVYMVRFGQGHAGGMTIPAFMGLLRWWTPPLERARFVTLSMFGMYGGSAAGFSMASVLADSFSWSAPFYIYGLLGVVWSFLWLWIVTEKPSSNVNINPQELMYIEKAIGHATQEEVSSIPWRKIFSSPPVWALIVATACRSWMFCVLTVAMPPYLGYLLHHDVYQSGILCLIPQVLLIFIIPIAGIIADVLLQKRIMSITRLRKTFNSLGMGLEALFIIGVAIVRFNEVLGLVFFMLAYAFYAVAIPGYFVNHLDIAPRYASVLVGLSGCFGSVLSILFPLVMNAFVPTETMENWEVFFYVCGSVNIIGAVFYGVFGSGEVQIWAQSDLTSEQGRGIHMSRESQSVSQEDGREGSDDSWSTPDVLIT